MDGKWILLSFRNVWQPLIKGSPQISHYSFQYVLSELGVSTKIQGKRWAQQFCHSLGCKRGQKLTWMDSPWLDTAHMDLLEAYLALFGYISNHRLTKASEWGNTLTGYVAPGRVGDGAWMAWSPRGWGVAKGTCTFKVASMIWHYSWSWPTS